MRHPTLPLPPPHAGAVPLVAPLALRSPLRLLLAEAAEHRRRGDLAAAGALEADALRVVREMEGARHAGR